MTTKELLHAYEIKTNNECNLERALYNLLRANEKHIEGLIENDDGSGYLFHKSFRTLDVTDSGYTDMAIWILINESELLWNIIKDNKDKESC